jgi:amino acid permease
MDFFLEAIPFVTKNMFPLTWQHAVGIVVLMVAGYYVMRWVMVHPLLRWTYIGVLVIFIVNLFHRGQTGKAAANIFKLALV